MLHTLMHHPVMKFLRKPEMAAYGAAALRLALGTIFMAHGYSKLFGNPAPMINFFARIGIPAPGFFVPFDGVVEFFGGLALILGLTTRFWAAGLMIDMFVAASAAKRFSSLIGTMGVELELSLFAANLFLFLAGAGAFSLDAWLMERMKKEHQAAVPMAGP